MFVGRLHPKKAVDNLLKAISLSEGFKTSDLKLKVVGDGDRSYIAELKRMVEKTGLSDRVEFVGHVEGDAKQQLYADAHWTFMPSHTENFGLVVLESLAQQTPVVASTGSPWKCLADERVGFWVNNSPESLAETISEIIRTPEDEYHGYRDRSRKYVTSHFDVTKFIDRWEQLYATI